jgi:Membrane bound YbgT-like protein
MIMWYFTWILGIGVALEARLESDATRKAKR